MKAIAKGDAGFAVIEHYAAFEAVADCLFEFAQSTKVGRMHCGRRLDFHAGDGTRRLLDDNICLDAVLVSEMEELGRCVVPTCLPSQFLIHKRFQKMSQQSSICRERLGVGAEQGCSETRVGEMQLRTLDQPLQSIAVPGKGAVPTGKASRGA